MTAPKFSPPKTILRQSSVLQLCADGLALVQGSSRDIDIADDLHWSKTTVSNVRERHHGLTLWLAIEAAAATDFRFLEPLFAAMGKRVVDIDEPTHIEDYTKMSSLAKMVAALAERMAPDSDGGSRMTNQEIIGMADTIDDLSLVSNDFNFILRNARKDEANKAHAVTPLCAVRRVA
jgi:hypothetical protein